jgi:ASC-1-like (ASCH) protein
VEANLICLWIVDRFVATRSIEKGKTVGRPPVNDEIVEDLRQRMEQNSKKIPQEVITLDHFPLFRKLLEKNPIESYKGWSMDCCLTKKFNCFYCKNQRTCH